MQKNYDLLMANGMWEWNNLQKERKNIRWKCVFGIKKDALAKILTYRMQLE